MNNPLLEYFENNENGRLIHKWVHYFDIYHDHFQAYRNTEMTILEIGVFHGGSLQMWKHYFGSRARVIGIDINPHCKDLEEEQITICIGNQSDRLFLRDVASRFGPFEIVLDDGGHKMHEQIITFEELYPHISNNGIYFCEDLHTSYWKKYGGGFRRGETFIEFAKGLIDKLNAWHSEDERLQPDDLTETMAGLHFYDSVLVIEKELREKPFHKKRGREGW